MEIKSNYATNPNSTANGKIDSDYKQNLPGDCALLASIFSLAQTKEGADKIENSVGIVKNAAGNILKYDVAFEGSNEIYTISQKELEDAKQEGERQYVTGDDDVTVLELALEKCFNNSNDEKLKETLQNYPSPKDDVLYGVNPSSVTYLLADQTLDTAYVQSADENSLKGTFIPQKDFVLSDINGNSVDFKEGQLYRPQETYVTDGTKKITIKDSKTEEIHTLNYEDFMQNTFAENSQLSTQKAKDLFESYEQNPDDNILILGVPSDTTVEGTNGDKIQLTSDDGHAYIVSEVDGDNVTLLNSSRPLAGATVSKDALLNLDGYWIYGTQKEAQQTDDINDANEINNVNKAIEASTMQNSKADAEPFLQASSKINNNVNTPKTEAKAGTSIFGKFLNFIKSIFGIQV